MKNYLVPFFLLTTILCLQGCGSVKNAYNLTNCTYKYNSISNMKISDMNLSNGVSAINATKLLVLLNGSPQSILMDFILNLEVYNPNTSQAAFQAMQYIIQVDDVKFTNGYITQAFNVNSGETKQLPINVGVDLVTLISNNSKDAVVNIAKNLIGLSSEKSNITVHLKPTFNIGGSLITSPVYIPVSFSFGGKKAN